MHSEDFCLIPATPSSALVTRTQSFCLYQLLSTTPTHQLSAAAYPLLRCVLVTLLPLAHEPAVLTHTGPTWAHSNLYRGCRHTKGVSFSGFLSLFWSHFCFFSIFPFMDHVWPKHLHRTQPMVIR